MKRWYLVILSLGLVTLAACGSNNETSAKASPKTSASSAAMDFKADASTVVDDLAAGDFAAVEAKFDATMKSELPVAKLKASWATYQEIVGDYKSHGEPDEVMKGEVAVERVPITTANGTGEVRVSYHPDGTIAGLFFLNADAPAP